MIEISSLMEVAVHTALQAGKLLTKGFGSSMEVKEKPGRHNLVTQYDQESEELILSSIRKRFPAHAFLGEEGGMSPGEDSSYLWIVDPLDGTVNFAHGIPLFSVSIACCFENEVVAGVVYQPITEELFAAQKGKGATRNGRPLAVTSCKELDEAFLVTGFPYNVEENPFRCIDLFAHLARKGIPLRRLGSAALDLSYVACGSFDGFWEVSLEPWDVAAGKLLVEEAGGRVTRYGGSAGSFLKRGTVVATNGSIHDELLEEIHAFTS